MSKKIDLDINPFKAERAESFFDKIDLFLNIFSPKPFEIGDIHKIVEYNDVIIFGAPGTGKTSILKVLCWEMLRNLKTSEMADYLFFRKLINLNQKTLPFFAFYININKELEEGFYGRQISDEIWGKIYLYYFCLIIIQKFIINLKKYNEDYCYKEISWERNRIPIWIKESKNLEELLGFIVKRISKVHEFLNNYYKDYENFDIELLQKEFFSEILNNILDSIITDFNTIFVILDDFSFIKVNLMPVILNFLGKRNPKIFIKIGSRISPALRFWPGMDRRDIITIDLDYEFINTKKNVYKNIISDIAIKRISTTGNKIATNYFENIFEKLTPEKEAQIYNRKINFSNDNFIKYLKKQFHKRNLLDDDYGEIYDFFNQREINPLNKKLVEILVARKLRKEKINKINKREIIEMFDFFTNLIISQEERYKNLKTIALHLLARDANMPKFYSGYNTIWKLSSYVFQNFLYILEKIFEEYSYQYGIAKPIAKDSIDYKLLNKVIHQLSSEYIEKRLVGYTEYGPDIKIFIQLLTKELLDQFRPQASYENGRTAFAIGKQSYFKLLDNEIIKDAVRYSYFQVKSIKKGLSEKLNIQDKHIAFYFNRIFLPYFNFPLKYGGYRKFSYQQIINILEKKRIIHPQQKSLIDFLKVK